MLTLTSPAFAPDGPIPRAHTCDGADLSPPMAWHGVPEETRELALIVDDPDAPRGTWVHWVLYGIPPTVGSLPAGVPTSPELAAPPGARQGVNDFGRTGWGGPCPPKGPAHRYVFTLYALDRAAGLPPGATKPVLLAAIAGHVLAETSLIGRYARA